MPPPSLRRSAGQYHTEEGLDPHEHKELTLYYLSSLNFSEKLFVLSTCTSNQLRVINAFKLTFRHLGLSQTLLNSSCCPYIREKSDKSYNHL